MDNFVDIGVQTRRKPLKIKAPAGMPAKPAKFKTYMNQQLGGAIALVAGGAAAKNVLRSAAADLCISQSFLTGRALDKGVSKRSQKLTTNNN